MNNAYVITVKRTSEWDIVINAPSADEAKQLLEEEFILRGGGDEILEANNERYVNHEIVDATDHDTYEGSAQWLQDAEQS